MNKIIKAFIIIFALLYVLTLFSKEDSIINSENLKQIKTFKEENEIRYLKYGKDNPKLSIEEIIKHVNVNLDIKYYSDVKEALNKYTNLVLVNKHYYLDEDYIPKNLTKIDYKYTSGIDVFGEENATQNFEKMCVDAGTIGLTIKTVSGYRSYEYQKNLYEKYLLNDPIEIVDTYSARSGHSEHQTGLAFDVYNVVKPYTLFGETDEYKWLEINAHKYGFIIRYKKENTYITGYKEEPWHIRYVGIENAKEIYMNNITLEEYLLNNT